jgi:hypothetical protein
MRRIKLLTTLFALIAGIVVIGDFLSQPSYSAPSSNPIVSVSEPDIPDPPLDIGKTFCVNVTIEQVINLYLWQAGLTFNATILDALNFTEGSFLKQEGSTLWVSGTINNTSGIITYHAASRVGNVTGISGNGTLGTITFQVQQYGSSTLHLTDIILLDPSLTEILGTIIVDYTVRIKIPGDINGDDATNVFDLGSLGKAYGSTPESPNWNAEADINKDNIIDINDLITLYQNYGITV